MPGTARVEPLEENTRGVVVRFDGPDRAPVEDPKCLDAPEADLRTCRPRTTVHFVPLRKSGKGDEHLKFEERVNKAEDRSSSESTGHLYGAERTARVVRARECVPIPRQCDD